MSKREVFVRFTSVGGDKLKADFAGIGAAGTKAMADIGKSSRAQAFQMQNAALQVGDFFVQVAGGQSATRALAQQMPQLLGSFGLFGALAGAAFAALSPLIAKMFEGEDAAKQLADSTEQMEKSTRAALDASAAARVPVAELAKTYGELADEVERARDRTEALAQSKAVGDVGVTAVDLSSRILGTGGDLRSNAALAALDTGLEALIAKADRLQEELSQGGGTPQMFQDLQDADQAIAALETVRSEVEDLADSLGITAEEAVRVATAANELRDAGSLREQGEAAGVLGKELVDVFGSVEAVDSALPGVLASLQKITEDAGQLSANIGLSADEAGRLARNMLAAAQQRLAAEGKVYSGRGGDPRTSNSKGVGEFVYTGPALDANNNVRPSRGGGGRRSGGGGASSEERQGLNEAKRLYEATRTEAEKYAEEVTRINDLHQRFGSIVTDDVRDRALKDLADDYRKATEQGKYFAEIQKDLKDGFLDAIVSGESLSDVFDNLAKSILRATIEAAAFGSGPFAGGGGGGGFLGNIFGAIFGGFRAGGGPVDAGKAYVVGEKGPELYVPGRAGVVVPNDRLGGGAGGQVDVRVFVDQSGSWAAEVQRISGQVSSAMIVQNNNRLREAQRR